MFISIFCVMMNWVSVKSLESSEDRVSLMIKMVMVWDFSGFFRFFGKNIV